MHVNYGGYHIRDIQFVAAFEVNKDKIGKDLSEAIWVKPNCCEKFADVPNLGVKVSPAPILDGVAPHMREIFNVYDDSKTTKDSIVKILKETKTQVLVNYLPVGSHDAVRFYAQCAIDAGCAFVNCMPEFIGSDSKEMAKKVRKSRFTGSWRRHQKPSRRNHTPPHTCQALPRPRSNRGRNLSA